MRKKLRRFGLLSKAILFTVIIHGALLVLLIFSFNWADPVKRGGAKPIQAVAVSEQAILEQVEKDRRREAEKKKQAEQAAKKLEELTRKQREEEQKLAELETKRKVEEQKQREAEAARKAEQAKQEAEKKRKAAEQKKKREEAERKKKLEDEKKRVEAEQKKKAEAERKKKLEAERKKKLAEEKKRKEAERKKKLEAEKKRKEAEKKKKLEDEKKRKAEEEQRQRDEEQLRRQLEEEQRVKTKNDAEGALTALQARIRAAVESNWLRPVGVSGLTATIRVKVARDGRVLSVQIVKSSGDPLFDKSAENAVYRASPLPFPENPKFYEYINDFQFKFDPPDDF